MDLQSACSSFHSRKLPCSAISPCQPRPVASHLHFAPTKLDSTRIGLSRRNIWIQDHLKLKSRLRSGVVSAVKFELFGELKSSRREIRDVKVNAFDGSEPLRGKPGSVSFVGMTHQSVDEGKLVSSPVEESEASIVWVLGPVALIAALVIPIFLGNAIEELFRNLILSEMITSFMSEIIFYIGLAMFLRVTDHVQKPYLQFSAKRWSLITGLRGYLNSAFFVMGFKIFAPLLAVYVTWPVLGLSALVAVTPFLAGCLVQFAFEKSVEQRDSSTWPLIPIIFEVYRIYQLNNAFQFIQTLMFAKGNAPTTPQLIERSSALISLGATVRVLALLSLWSLLTFLLRLFPSRPVAENY